MHETFWGVPCLSGDDKRLTTLILERGYLTYMQRSAEVWSTFPNTWRIFFKQRLRWARNTWRSDLRALSRPWVYRHPFLAYTMIDKGAQRLHAAAGARFMVHALISQNWIFAAVLAGWWQLTRSAKLLPHLRRRPSSFLFIPGYVFVSWIMAIIKLQALLTIRRQRWLTRQVAVENGEVVRTTGADTSGGAGGGAGAAGPAGAGGPVTGCPWPVGDDADPPARSGPQLTPGRRCPQARSGRAPGLVPQSGPADRAVTRVHAAAPAVRGGLSRRRRSRDRCPRQTTRGPVPTAPQARTASPLARPRQAVRGVGRPSRTRPSPRRRGVA